MAFSTVNRWENGKNKPNIHTMKKIKDFCDFHNLDFSILEGHWTENEKDEK